LIPGDNGAVQATESFVGPYALQDFNLFYLTRLGYRPSKIAFLAWNAWHDAKKGAWPVNVPESAQREYSLEEIRREVDQLVGLIRQVEGYRPPADSSERTESRAMALR